jgi:hypothetical protein
MNVSQRRIRGVRILVRRVCLRSLPRLHVIRLFLRLNGTILRVDRTSDP